MRLDAAVGVVVASGVVLDRISATADGRLVPLLIAVVKQRATRVGLDLGEVESGTLARCRVEIVAREPSIDVVHEPRCSLTRRYLEARRPGFAALRDDLDDAVRCLRSIERRSGRTFDDLDALDVVGVEVVQSRDRAGAVAARWSVAVHPNAIDVNDRVGAERKARSAADENARAAARESARRRDDDARRARVEQLTDVAHGRGLHDVRDLHLRDGVADASLLGRAGGAGDDHRVQIDRELLQRDANVGVADPNGTR